LNIVRNLSDMKIKNQNAVKAIMIIIMASVLFTFIFLIPSCRPELNFGELVVCPEVDTDTLAPLEIRDNFDTGIEKIFAVIDASGVKAEDVWRFIWKNKDTKEVIADSTGSYSENESGYMEGYLSNYIVPGEEGGIIGEPGNYSVDFYHNGQLISSTDFVIEAPELEVIGVTFSKEVDNLGKPVEVFNKFYPDDIIKASIKLNRKKKGDYIGVKWYRGDDELLGEDQFNIKDDYYLENYIVFVVSNDEPWPIGEYRLEVFHNNLLEGSHSFEIVRKEMPDAVYDQNNIYQSEDYKFSIGYPDGWNYEEKDIENGLEVVFVPESDYLDVRIKMKILEKGYFPGKEEYSDFADSIVKDLDIEILDNDTEVQKTESSGEIDDTTYSRVNYNYPGESENGWDIDLIFINRNSKLYLFLKISVMYYKGFADKVYGGMLGSLQLE
jgi:hypothetical protein